jgi:uncharacterized repeat protein (TIGR01451 family)
MRRFLVALLPIILASLFVLFLLNIFSTGAAAARPLEEFTADLRASLPGRASLAASRAGPAEASGYGDSLPFASEGIDSPAATLEITVNYAHDWVAGTTDTGATVVVTVTDGLGAVKADAVVTADGATGDFFVSCEDWFSGWCPDIVPGDVVLAWAAGLSAEVNPIGTINGKLDAAENTVDGYLMADWFAGPLDVACEILTEFGATITATAGTSGGSFQCDFDNAGWDLQRGDTVALSYYEPDGDRVINILHWPWARVNYAHDWVGVNYAAGHTFVITVTDSLGAVRATALAESHYGAGWGEDGFDSSWEQWSPNQPDIQPFDVVYFAADDGYTKTLEVGEIGGILDVASDTVSGPIFASIAGVTLPVECHPWGAWNVGLHDVPVRNSWADPDGSVPYSCSWDPSTEWDVQPGQDIGVMYLEPDDDRIINVFREPAPYLRIEKWADAQAGEGGNFVFHINFRNEGDGLAENVVITDIMEGGLSYLSDNSGLGHSGSGGGPIVWDVGALDPGQGVQFELFVEVTGVASDIFTNTATVATDTPGDQGEPWEKSATWTGQIQENDTHLNVGKWAWTGEPTPGEEFVFGINVCNNGSTASSQVTLDDSLQYPDVALQYWWANQAGWSEVYSDPGQLTLAIPSIPGYACRDLYLRVNLDPGFALGGQITNLATVSADNDMETEDNEVYWEGYARAPFTNIWVNKWWNWGVLAPNGELSYGVSYGNDGNVPVGPFWITETLPAGTTFQWAWFNDPWGGHDFPPTVQTADYVAWEIPSLDNGYSADFEVRLRVDVDAQPGELTNVVQVTSLPGEDRYDDNQASWTEYLNPPGPNLRIKKWHSWDGDWRLNYTINFENVGDATIFDLWVTDFLPEDSYWDGWWDMGFDWNRLVDWGYDEGSRTLSWNFSELNPGEAGWLHFNADLDFPGEPLRWYTNTVQITVPPGDVNPGDNAFTDVAFSGGEVRRVEFWLHPGGTADIWGEAIPGYPVTVTLNSGQFYAWADPGCGGCWNVDGRVTLAAGDPFEVVAGPGLLPVSLVVPDPIEVEVDSTANEVFGQIGGWSERPVEIHGAWLNGYREVQSAGDGAFAAAYPDIPRGGRGYVRFMDAASYAQVIYHRPFWDKELVLDVNYGHNWVEGFYEPGHVVWITVTENDGSTVKGTAELETGEVPWWAGDSGFSTNWQGWLGQQPDLQAGDWVFAESDTGHSAAVRLGDIDFVADYAADVVSGNLYAGWLGLPLVSLRCELWNHPDNPGVDEQVDPDGGAFSCDFGAAGYDVAPGNSVGVMYWEPEGHRILNAFDWPLIRAGIGPNSGGDRYVWGHGTTPFATVVVTVTTDLGVYVAGSTSTADEWGNWDTGETLPEGTLAPWNVIEVDFGNTIIDSMTVYPMDATADPDTDIVEITAAGHPSFTVDLDFCTRDGWCDEIGLGEIGPSGNVSVDLAAERGFDIRHGDSFQARLNVENGHILLYSWLLPAPELGVWKGQISGYARPGGLFPYTISYHNQGNGPAENTLIVDTLPAGTTYAGDNSGFVVTDGGSTVNWDLGTVEPGTGGKFVVTLAVSPAAPTGTAVIDQNCVAISTASPGDWDPGNNESCADPVDVWEDEVELGVNSWAQPNDPSPGQEFDYRIDWCNNRGAAAGPVVLTDTLPSGVTLLGWWPEDWYNPWNEVTVGPDLLVLEAPSLPGHSCSTVKLRVLLDAGVPVSTTLVNQVELAVADYVYLDNNWHQDTNTHVSPPRYDLVLRKDHDSGVLVPGGHLNFSVNYTNRGNVETTLRITDTMPAGMSYREGWWGGNTPWEGQPLPDPDVIGNQLVWDLPAIPVNADYNLHFTLEINESVVPGAELQNCAAIVSEGDDSYPADNEACVSFTVQDSGPNLWLEKSHSWNGDWQLNYWVNFANFGDQMVSEVWITDTLPAGTHWDGWWNMGFDWNRLVNGELIVDGDKLIWHFTELYAGDWGWLQFNANLDEPGAPVRWYTNTLEISVPVGESVPEDNTCEDVAFSGGEVRRVEFWLQPDGTADVWGEAVPGYPVTVTLNSGHFYAWADPECGGCWNLEESVPLTPGDPVEVVAGPGLLPVSLIVPEPIEVAADSSANQVFGQIGGWSNRTVQVHGGWVNGYREVLSAGDGSFVANFPEIPRGGRGYIRFMDAASYAQVVYHRPFWDNEPALNINYGHDWIEGFYEPGHTIWITVSESDGTTVKGTAELYSGEVPWWGGESGFATYWQGWTGKSPDILPGDWVHVLVDNGYSDQVQVFTIGGQVDVEADSVAGAVDAPWLVGLADFLPVECHPWGAHNVGIPAENKYSQASPDGATPYLCEWDPATEWDVDFYQEIGVSVQDPSGHWIYNVFQGEGIDLNVSKWRAIPDNPTMPGGVVVYGVFYQNNGNIPAENVQIVDTLPAHTSYAGDTSGLPVTNGSGTVTWDVGTVYPGDFIVFRLTLDVSESAPPGMAVIAPNCLEISSSTGPETNPDDNQVCSETVDVVPGEVEIGVNKWVWPEDPSPGERFFYTIEWCNNRPWDAGPVVLTDTLPAGTTLLEWHEREWWMNFWTELSFNGSELVLGAPGLQGDRCEQIDLVMQLDPQTPLGTVLVNEVTVAVEGDVYPDNNHAVNDAAQAGPPRYDLGVNKQFHNGQLLPGGSVNYFIDYHNNGNVSTGVTITETVPPGLTFEGAWWGGGQEGENEPLPEPLVFGNLLTWELGSLPVGGGRWFHVEFSIDPGLQPGTEIANCVIIAADGDDSWPDNNEACTALNLSPAGPNVRVTKSHWWPNLSSIQYEISFWNTGDEPLTGVVITDTLPSGVSPAGEPWYDHWSGIQVIDNTAAGQWLFVVEELNPGDRGTIWFDVNLDDPDLIPAWYTNTVEIASSVGDVDPGDNLYVDLAGLIPDAILRISPAQTLVTEGSTFVVDVEVADVTDLQAITLEITFDPAVLHVVDANLGTPELVEVEPGDCPTPDVVLVNSADNTAGTIHYDAFSTSGSCSGAGNVLRITFEAIDGGVSPVHFNSWITADSDGFDIPVRVEDGEVVVSDLGLLQGQVELQGRKNHSGAEVCVEAGAGTLECTTTDAGGYYAFWLEAGVYDVTVEMMPYLGAVKNGVSVNPGSTTRLAKVKLLGGDAIDDGAVNILDLALMGGRYLSVCGQPAYDERGDINGDCAIDIRDMAIAGSNYGGTEPVNWP